MSKQQCWNVILPERIWGGFDFVIKSSWENLEFGFSTLQNIYNDKTTPEISQQGQSLLSQIACIKRHSASIKGLSVRIFLKLFLCEWKWYLSKLSRCHIVSNNDYRVLNVKAIAKIDHCCTSGHLNYVSAEMSLLHISTCSFLQNFSSSVETTNLSLAKFVRNAYFGLTVCTQN